MYSDSVNVIKQKENGSVKKMVQIKKTVSVNILFLSVYLLYYDIITKYKQLLNGY